MAFEYHYRKVGLGYTESPLSLIEDVVNAHPDWVVKKTAYEPHPTGGVDVLSEVWIEAINTTSGQTLAMQFTYFQSDRAIRVAYSRDTDLNLPWDQQPEAPFDSVSREGTYGTYDFTVNWGITLSPTYTIIVISRDLIHVIWQGGHNSSGNPYRITAMYCALDKSHNYLDGVYWTTSHKSGKSYFGVHYNEHWYQEGFGTTGSIEGLQCRINDLANSTMFEKNFRVHGKYVLPISVHCNTGLNGADTALELAGFVPGGAYGTTYYSFPNLLIQEEINSKWYVAMPSSYMPYINTILYPLS